ncbi:MAG: hypothetical protein K0Q66_1219 [Chitinophagaceae bacterium]|jgi:hypothetical protein|nr:hypothetical protein [Chitinophagaceae bacterium]
MKPLYSALFIAPLFFATTTQAQLSSDPPATTKELVVGFGYELALPGGEMKKGMRSLHSMKITAAFPLESVCENMEAGIDLGYGLYGMKKINMRYNFSGNYVNTDVNYSSSVVQAGMTASYLFGRNNKLVPYVTAKAGYAGFFSAFQVEDPRDASSCRVVEHKSIASDGTAYWGYGGGLRIRQGTKYVSNFIDVSIQKVRGGQVKYVNVNRMHDLSDPYVASGGAPVKFEFVNGSTQQVHEHTVAELYRSALSLLQFTVTYVAYLKF